jgi:hypothetical protein
LPPPLSAVGSPASGKKASRRDLVSNFECIVPVPVRLRGPAQWTVLGCSGA